MLQFIGEWLLGAAAFVLIVFVLGTALYSLRRRALRRKRRHAQQHRSTFPYRAIFYVSIVLTLCACGLTVYLIRREGLSHILYLPAAPLLLAIWSFRGYVLQRMPSAAQAIEQNPRPPVLYLRSFDQENLIFAVLKDQAKFNDLLLFEPHGQPLILKRGAFQPEEYIDPIHERLRQLNLVPGDEKPAGTSGTTRE